MARFVAATACGPTARCRTAGLAGARICSFLWRWMVGRIAPSPPVKAVREHALAQIAALPEEFKRMRNPQIYEALLSEELGTLKDRMLSNPDLA